MRKSISVFAALVFVLAPFSLSAQEEGRPGKRCLCSGCPVAKTATTLGFEVVSKLAVTNVRAGEFLS